MKFLAVLPLLSIAGVVSAFSVPSRHVQKRTKVELQVSGDETDGTTSDSTFATRRSFLASAQIVSAATAAGLFDPHVAAAADESMGSSGDSPISVIGAGGKTGSILVDVLANQKGLYTRAVTRSGREVLSSPSSFVSNVAGDVSKYEVLLDAVKGSSGVIFAASASGKKKGGDPEHVDYLGLYNTAKACVELGIPKLVVISAALTTRPENVGFKATNLFTQPFVGPKIMDYKSAGEYELRKLFAGSSKSSYSIVRPGGLKDNKAEGPTTLLVSQGDFCFAEITRNDVAQVTIAALLKGKATDFTTFEVSGQKDLVKVENLPDPPANLIHNGAPTYDGLLDGLLTDAEMNSSQSIYLNDFHGDKIAPIEAVV